VNISDGEKVESKASCPVEYRYPDVSFFNEPDETAIWQGWRWHEQKRYGFGNRQK